ncbi:hypothetical protein DDV93_19275 [Cereibacter johrii]|nr:hypothetical protein DDV93_19275 [Cereibacter johrii]
MEMVSSDIVWLWTETSGAFLRPSRLQLRAASRWAARRQLRTCSTSETVRIVGFLVSVVAFARRRGFALTIVEVSAPDHWPVFIISLKDATERRRSVLRQCEQHGIVPTFFDAVDGRAGLPDDLEQLVDRQAAVYRVARNITDPEYACALSHHMVYRRIVEEGLPGAIILEDDAILTESFGRFYASRSYQIADFIQMDHQHASVYRWRGKKVAGGVTLLPLGANAGLTTGYSVANKAARYLVANSLPLAGFADWPCDITPLSPYVTEKTIVHHPEFDAQTSYIEAQRAQQVEKSAASRTEGGRWLRFLRGAYWKRWWFKRITKRIS